jgi:hypothetical protein
MRAFVAKHSQVLLAIGIVGLVPLIFLTLPRGVLIRDVLGIPRPPTPVSPSQRLKQQSENAAAFSRPPGKQFS